MRAGFARKQTTPSDRSVCLRKIEPAQSRFPVAPRDVLPSGVSPPGALDVPGRAASRVSAKFIDTPVHAFQPVEVQARATGGFWNEAVVGCQPSPSEAAAIHSAAAHGVSGPGQSLPHFDAIQRSFGNHDLSSIVVHTGVEAKAATRAIDATAYATGEHIAFGDTPSLLTAAHEAAHIVQQRAGVQIPAGVGRTGDMYERQADEVAALVGTGRSAEPVLDQLSLAAPRGAATIPGSNAAGAAVQLQGLKESPTAKAAGSAFLVEEPLAMKEARQKQLAATLAGWAKQDVIKRPMVTKIAQDFIASRPKPVAATEWPSAVGTYRGGASSGWTSAGSKVADDQGEATEAEVFDALYAAMDLTKIRDGGAEWIWQTADVSETSEKNMGEKAGDMADFATDQLSEKIAGKIASKIENKAFGVSAIFVLENIGKNSFEVLAKLTFEGVASKMLAGPQVAVCLLAIDVVQLLIALSESVDRRSPAKKRQQAIAATVIDWLHAEKEAAARKKRMSQPFKAEIKEEKLDALRVETGKLKLR